LAVSFAARPVVVFLERVMNKNTSIKMEIIKHMGRAQVAVVNGDVFEALGYTMLALIKIPNMDKDSFESAANKIIKMVRS